MSPQQLLPLGLLVLSSASVSALRQPIGRITSLNRNRLVADEEDRCTGMPHLPRALALPQSLSQSQSQSQSQSKISLFYRAPRLVNHADGAA